MTETPTLTLNDGRAMPQFGMGTYKIADGQVAAIVRTGLDIGYPLVDTAGFYANERGVGEGLNGADPWVTTKVWKDRMGHDEALRAFDESLALLGRSSVDLFLIHWPAPSTGKYVETWRALVRLREEGRAKSIGVSNFYPEHIEAIIDDSGVTPAVNQIELHPRFQQRAARAFHDKHGIVTQSWSPLGQGEALNAPEVRLIADKHGRSAAQIILAWHLAKRLAVIPKASDRDHLSDNFAALDVTLDEEDVAAIDAMDDADGRIGPDPMSM